MLFRRSIRLLFSLSIPLSARSVLAAPADTTADAVLGQVNFTSNQANQGGANGTPSTLNEDHGLCVDSAGRLWIADKLNNRVLRYASAATFINGQAADLVLGQADFVSIQENRGGANPTSNTLAGPHSLAFDSAGRLYVADSGNIRILRFDPPFSNGMNAVQVFGQAGSFTTRNQATMSGATASNLGNPNGVAVDSAGNLWMADRFLSRVLRYNTPASGGDTTADLVIGQPNFTSGNANQGGANPAANALSHPESVAVDGQDRLYVADEFNSRVLLFVPPFTTNMNATRVFGQPNFTTGTAANPPTANSLNNPVRTAIDPISGNLYIADAINNRVLEFTNPLSSSTASRVFGQLGDFTTSAPNRGGLSADSLSDPAGVACDANGNLFIGDRLNHRALRFNAPPPDSDGDGVPDAQDVCPNNAPGLPVDCTGRPLRDCNHDCLVNAADVQCIVNEMLSQ